MMSLDEIREQYSPEMAFVILTARVYFGRASGVKIAEYLQQNEINWKGVLEVISAHKVRPLIFNVLSQFPQSIDQDFLGKLRGMVMHIASGNLYKFEEVFKVHSVFNSAGISNFPYKGVLLSQFLFGDLVTRETADIDFLIAPQDLQNARMSLLALDYRTIYTYRSGFDRHILSSSCEMPFSRDSGFGRLILELHWAVTHRMMDVPISVNDLLADAQMQEINGRKFNMPALEDHIVMLLIHHGVNDIWRVIRHVFDIAAILEKYGDVIDWSKVYKRLNLLRVRHTADVGFGLCGSLLGVDVPPVFRETSATPKTISYLLKYPIIKKFKLTAGNFEHQLALRDSAADKLRVVLRYCREAFIPNRRDIELVDIPRQLFFLYYLVKPYRLLFKRK